MLPWLPESVSTFGADIDHLFRLIFIITAVVFILVQAALVVFLLRYRHRPGRRAVYTHGNNRLEIAWTIAPSIILVVLALLSRATWNEVRGQMPPSDYQVEVTAKQFNWEMRYPGPDGRFGTADDLTLENDLNVPVNQVIRVTLKSRDVIHSFFLPNLRLKQDTLPGRAIAVWFQATKTGRYEIACAELCGFGHSGMKGWLTVRASGDYQQWVQEHWPSQEAGA